jgi:hypothetical protein
MVPGTQLVLTGLADRGNGLLPHRSVMIVTDLTKVIDGVRTRVVWDLDYNGGQLVESELAFFAQDDNGNVWNLGEYPEEYDNGRFTGAPNTWIGGVAGAEPGISMLANPMVGDTYTSGFAPQINFFDVATVAARGQSVCVPVGCFGDVLVIDESSPLAPEEGHQLKFYAPGVGNIKVLPVGGEQGEQLQLVSVSRLGPRALSAVRVSVLRLDRRAYTFSAVYRSTPPIVYGR